MPATDNVDRTLYSGGSKVGQDGCSSSQSLATSVRQAFLALAGVPREVLADPTKNLAQPLQFCFPNVAVVSNVQQDGGAGVQPSLRETWKDNNYQVGTCDINKQFNDPNRLCIMATPTNLAAATPYQVPATATSVPRGYVAYALGSTGHSNIQPTPNAALNIPNAPQLNGRPLANQPLAIEVVPWNPGYLGIVGFQPNIVPTQFPSGQQLQFGLSLPAWRPQDFDNAVRERMRWVLAMACQQFGLPIEPGRIYITSLSDLATSFPPLPDGSRAGIYFQFTLDVADTSYVANFTMQLTGGPNTNTLGGQAGPVLAALGVVPFRLQTLPAFRKIPAATAVPADVTSAVVGSLFGIGLALGLYYWRFGSFCGYVIPNVLGIFSPAAKKANPNRKVGEVVTVTEGPPRKGSHVETANPMAGAAAVAAAAAAAKPAAATVAAPAGPAAGTVAVAVNTMRATAVAAAMNGSRSNSPSAGAAAAGGAATVVAVANPLALYAMPAQLPAAAAEAPAGSPEAGPVSFEPQGVGLAAAEAAPAAGGESASAASGESAGTGASESEGAGAGTGAGADADAAGAWAAQMAGLAAAQEPGAGEQPASASAVAEEAPAELAAAPGAEAAGGDASAPAAAAEEALPEAAAEAAAPGQAGTLEEAAVAQEQAAAGGGGVDAI